MHKTESRIRKQDNLVQLIHTLNGNEKRYFKLYNSLQSGSKKYALLFDELARSTRYDAEALSKKLKITKKQLADDKTYLLQVLLKSLRNHHDGDEEVNLYAELSSLTILQNKGMLEFALSRIPRLKQKAADLNNFRLEAELLKKEIELIYTAQYTAAADRPTMERVLKESRVALQNALDFMEIGKLQYDASYFQENLKHSRNRENLAAVHKLIRNPKLNVTYASPLIEIQRLICLASLYQLTGQHANSVETYDAFFAKTPKELKHIAGGGVLIQLLNNLFYQALSSGQWQKAQQVISGLEKLRYGAHRLDATIILPMFGKDLAKLTLALKEYLFYHGRISKGTYLITLEKVERDWPEIRPTSFPYVLIPVASGLGKGFLLTGKPDKAVEYFQYIINETDANLLHNIQVSVRLLHLMAHFDLGNYSIIESLVGSSLRMAKKKEQLNTVETLLLRHLTQVRKWTTIEKRREAFTKLSRQLHKLKDTASQKNMRDIYLERWMEKYL